MNRKISLVWIALFCGLLVACGGGGGGTQPAPTAPSALQYPTPPAFVVQQAITALTPQVTGQVTSYTVSPTLPSGISIDPASGVISGTPVATTAKATYTVTASNGGGSTSTTVPIVVNGMALSAITYPSSSYVFTTGVATQDIAPTASPAGTLTWSVNPALPAGLSLSATNGSISGTPSAAASPASYVVTASNSAGQSTVTLTITVSAAVLDLGHGADVILVRTGSSRVLSLDSLGHWLLQDPSAGTIPASMLASGGGVCSACVGLGPRYFPYPPVDLAGSTFIDVTDTALEVRSSTDGHLLASVPGHNKWYRLATDGSYVATGTTSWITAYDTSGHTLFTRTGDYSMASVFTAPGQILVANGPAGANLIETIAVPTGTSSTSPTFQGQFNTWFVDGARFLTNQANTIWVYSNAGVQQDQAVLPNLGTLTGQGNWFWTFDGALLNVYKVGASSSPTFSQSYSFNLEQVAVPSGTTIGVMPAQQSTQFAVVDLSGSTPTSATHTAGFVPLVYAETPSAGWVIGAYSGVVIDQDTPSAQPHDLTYGAAVSIAAGTSNFSVATASGSVLIFDATNNAQVHSIDFAASQLSASSDGTVLAAAGNNTINIYSLPSGNLTKSIAYTAPATALSRMSLSGSGTVLGEVFASNAPSAGCYADAIPVAGGATLWCGTTNNINIAWLSPDGTLVAASMLPTGSPPAPTTSLYKNGTLVTTVGGSAVGWLDNNRLLVNNFVEPGNGLSNYAGSVIYDATGHSLSTPTLPLMHFIDVVNANSVYSPEINSIVSLTDGSVIWAGGSAGVGVPNSGAVAGSQVVYAAGNLVLAQPY